MTLVKKSDESPLFRSDPFGSDLFKPNPFGGIADRFERESQSRQEAVAKLRIVELAARSQLPLSGDSRHETHWLWIGR